MRKTAKPCRTQPLEQKLERDTRVLKLIKKNCGGYPWRIQNETARAATVLGKTYVGKTYVKTCVSSYIPLEHSGYK